MVEIEIRPENTAAEPWVAMWAERALDAWHHEPETLACEAMVSVDDDSRNLIFQRYAGQRKGAGSIIYFWGRPFGPNHDMVDRWFPWWRTSDRFRREPVLQAN